MQVLLAEDDPVLQFRLKSLLQIWGYDTVVAATGTEAWQALQNDDVPPLVLLDWMLPGIDGMQICRSVREGARRSYVYIIMLTGKDRDADIVAGLQAGADDYVTKPFNSEELKARLHTGRRIIALQAELIAARQKLRVRASHDGNTALWNEAATVDLLDMELRRAKSHGFPGAILMIEVDRLRQIIETYGGLTGDTVLCHLVQKIRSVLRAYDIIGELQKTVITAILPGCAAADALKLVKRIEVAMGRELDLPEGRIPITLSAGMAFWDGARSIDVQTIMSAAQAALERAKETGDRVELATTLEMTAGTLQRSEPPILVSECQPVN